MPERDRERDRDGWTAPDPDPNDLNDLLDDLSRTGEGPADPGDGSDPTAGTLRRLRALDAELAPPPGLADRIWENLMTGHTIAHQPTLPFPRLLPGGTHANGRVPGPPPPRFHVRAARPLGRLPQLAAAAILLLALVGGIVATAHFYSTPEGQPTQAPAAAASPAATDAADAGVEERNKAVIRRFYEGWSTDDGAIFAEVLAPGAIEWAQDGQAFPITTDEPYEDEVAGFRSFFPDLTVTVDDLVAEGDRVTARVTMRGTHLADFPVWFVEGGTVPATGKPVTVAEIQVFRLEDGRIVEMWGAPDFLGLLLQLGVRFQPPAAHAAGAPARTASARLLNAAGNEAGIAVLAEGADGRVTVQVSIQRAPLPGTEHGIHVHETGACEPKGEQAFASAGGHFNPTGATHGEHAGDLGNLETDDGWVEWETTTDRFTLSPGPTSILDEDGAALVVHLSADDGQTDPSGNSGPRYLCGVIVEGRSS